MADAVSDPETVSAGEVLSPAGHALRVHVERIDRVARRHEQSVAVTTAEADIGSALGQRYEADRPTGRIEHLDAVERWAHAPATPQIAVDVKVFNPAGRAIGFIALPERAANVCFGGRYRNRLFMAASHSIYSLYVNAQGVAGG